MIEVGKRLMSLREQKGLLPAEAASAIGVSLAQYNDFELSDELYSHISLRNLKKLTGFFAVSGAFLFSGKEAGEKISFEHIRNSIEQHIMEENVSLSKFEDEIGWELERFLQDSEAAWDWNVECLKDVCDSLKIDWLSALSN